MDDNIRLMITVQLRNNTGTFVGVVLDYELKLAGYEINLEQVRVYEYSENCYRLLLTNGTVLNDRKRELEGFIEISVPGIREVVKIVLGSELQFVKVNQIEGSLEPTKRVVRVLKPAKAVKHSEAFGSGQQTANASSVSNANALPIDRALATLGLPLDSPREEIDKAYRKKLKDYHPDRVLHLGEKLVALAQEETKRINRAYETVKQTLEPI